jgi:hypothetical protein
MDKKFDIAITGSSIQSALLLYKSVQTGLKAACFVSELIGGERFITFNQIFFKNPLKHIAQRKTVNELKNIASHLLLSTQVEEHLKLSIFELFLLKASNLLGNNKIKVKKSATKSGFYQLSYPSYKLSINRLWQTVLKSIDKSNYQVFNLDEKDAFEDLINQQKVGKVSIFNELTNEDLSKSIFVFTYPNSELKLEKTILWKDKKLSLRIVPWFDGVYFEMKSSGVSENGLNKAIKTIANIFPELKIEKDKVLATIKKTSDFSVNVITDRLTRQSTPNLKKNEPLIGSNFNFLYHPLRMMEYCDEKYDEAKHILQNPHYFKKLFYRYGTEIDKVTYQAYEFWNQTKDIKKTWLMAEIWYVFNYEQCTSAEEFIYQHTEEWMLGENINNELIKNLFEELTNKE